MRFKKIWAVVLAAAMAASMSACGNDKEDGDTDTAESTTAAAETTTTAAAATTAAETKKTENATSAADEEKSEAASVKVYYGWGTGDEEEYTAEIFCPKGASFSITNQEDMETDGLIMTAQLTDETNEYVAMSNSHWHRDAYNSEPTAYPIIAQLYFDGKLDAETEKEYTDCSQTVTPLGFQWNGMDVMMIETKYTFMDYGEQTELFAGVEYDLKYWKATEGTGEIQNLTTKGLFGFDMYSTSLLEEIDQEKCAWITGELFGVDSGVENPFAKNDEQQEEAAVNVDKADLIGTWIDNESDWEDTYIFNADGTGIYKSGPEYEFTYKVDGNILSLVYAEDDIETYTIKVEDGKISLTDKFNCDQYFEKFVTEETTAAETEQTVAEEPSNPNVTAIIGTWKEGETGIDETFIFNPDGTGKYSCLYGDGTYECNFTYEFFRSDYIDIHYDDGDEGGFQLEIVGDKMTVRNDTAWDLVYTRQ